MRVNGLDFMFSPLFFLTCFVFPLHSTQDIILFRKGNLMPKHIDIDALQEAVQEAEKIDKVRSRLKELSTTLERLNSLQGELAEILEGKPSRKTTKKTKKAKGKKAGKQAHPKPGSAPEKLCKILGKTPKSVEQIAKECGLTEGTVKAYLNQFDCFQNVWGKGYVYNPQGGKAQAAPKGAKKKTSRKTKKTKKTTKKATEAATTT
jgi:hypothetical protein